MKADAVFLHITDAHISKEGVAFPRDDHKVKIPAISQDKREEVLDLLLRRLAEQLRRDGVRLAGALFSGDAQHQGQPGGHELLLKLLLKHLKNYGITADRIVATPGNHDVPRDAAPSIAARYKPFMDVWSAAGCVVPWLDGVNSKSVPNPERHWLLADDRRWAIFPVNTSNWSQITSELPKELKSVWATIPKLAAGADANLEKELRKQLDDLTRYDMARVSKYQLEALRKIVSKSPKPAAGRQLRIAMMHHHLRSPSLREELKPFADMSNIEQVRAFIQGSGIDVVVHGHKHEHAADFEHIYAGGQDHRTLVISGATFDPKRELDAARLITISGLPYTPQVQIQTLALPRSGAETLDAPAIVKRLWVQTAKSSDPIVVLPGAPVVVEGSNLDEVYARACAAAETDAARGTLIVHLDLAEGAGDGLPLPADYPFPEPLEQGERHRWLQDLVKWWQIDRSQLEHRRKYLHGARLRRYGGKIDQISRIIALLGRKSSTRAVAVLVDPFRDFTLDANNEEFASFCLVEFRRHDNAGGERKIDAIAFYRAQEMARWWPINVAELRLLQREICRALGFTPGRITTIAGDARTNSRTPTQVAMPVVDRWLDQAPERVHLLADAIVHKAVRGEHQKRAVREWGRALSELRSATEQFNADGIPVAIEGLFALAAYVEVSAEANDAGAARFVRLLRDLASSNQTFEKSGGEPADFQLWAPSAARKVKELVRFTATRLAQPTTPLVRSPGKIGSRD